VERSLGDNIQKRGGFEKRFMNKILNSVAVFSECLIIERKNSTTDDDDLKNKENFYEP